MKAYVLDSYALLAYAEGEAGAEIVSGLFQSALENKIRLFLCVVNWGEMYYIVLREQGRAAADKLTKTFQQYPISIIDAGMELTLSAAELKAFHKMSYADAFAAALTKRLDATLVTGDKEFDTLSTSIQIEWI